MSVNSKDKKILIVDDDSLIRESLSLILSRHYTVELATDGESALEIFKSGESRPDLAIVDVMMPGMSGIELLEEISLLSKDIQVVMLTASRAVPSAVKAMKIGAVDYLSKPFDVDELLGLVKETLEKKAVVENKHSIMLGSHEKMQSLQAKIDQLAPKETTVLITGESGVGKNLIAKEIHIRGQRADKPFVVLDCAATNSDQELFGDCLGSQSLGRLEQASGGTLYLDEVSALSEKVQSKLLRFLESREFFKIGSVEPTKVDVRIIASSNSNLEKQVAEKLFRKDLFYRLKVVTLEVPSLRSRKADIEELVEHFQKKLMPLYGQRKLIFSQISMQFLQSYDWPGNVRELENVVESLLALCPEDIVQKEHLPKRVQAGKTQYVESDLEVRESSLEMGFEKADQAFQKELILKALLETDFVQTKAAKLLGISRRVLKYRMDKLGISKQDYKEDRIS